MFSKNAFQVMLVTPTASPQGVSDSKTLSAFTLTCQSRAHSPAREETSLPALRKIQTGEFLTDHCLQKRMKNLRKRNKTKMEDRWPCLWSQHSGNIPHFPTTRKRTTPHCEASFRENCPQANNPLFTTKDVCLSYVATFAHQVRFVFWSRTALFQEIKIYSR